VRIEGNDTAREVARDINKRVNHMTVPEMNPIEISKGDHSPFEA
jgi:hypothetical protein